jgi:hypothetical protein
MYERADLQSVTTASGDCLNLNDNNKLPKLLTKFHKLFSGTLGD